MELGPVNNQTSQTDLKIKQVFELHPSLIYKLLPQKGFLRSSVVLDLHQTLLNVKPSFIEWARKVDGYSQHINANDILRHPFPLHPNPEVLAAEMAYLGIAQEVIKIVPFEGSLDSLRKIAENGLRPVIVSANKPRMHEAHLELIERLGFLDIVDITDIHQRESVFHEKFPQASALVFKTRTIFKMVRPIAIFDDDFKICREAAKRRILSFNILQGTPTPAQEKAFLFYCQSVPEGVEILLQAQQEAIKLRSALPDQHDPRQT